MSETPPKPRPILRLKVAVQPPTTDFAIKTEPKPAYVAPPKTSSSKTRMKPPPPPVVEEPEPIVGARWRCKPCGGLVVITDEMVDDEVVHCQNCNARLGLVADFRAEPPPAKLRARPAK